MILEKLVFGCVATMAAVLAAGSAAATPPTTAAPGASAAPGTSATPVTLAATSAPPGRTVVNPRMPLPAIIGASPSVKQMITVSSGGFGSTTATLNAWRRTANGHWVRSRGPVPAVIGYGGWVVAADRRQNTGTTPAGRFRLPAAFGRLPDPGARIRYRHVDGDDWWPYEPRDPGTYNVFQTHRAARTHWRPTFAEHLDDYTAQYAYAVEVGFNLPSGVHYSRHRHQWVATRRADTRRGGGIFLHVRGHGRTAGCVAMDRNDIRWLLRWIRPTAEPRLVMGPHRYIVGL